MSKAETGQNVMMGLAVAVLGFVAYQTYGKKGAGASAATSAASPAASSFGPNAGALNSSGTWTDGSEQVAYNNAYASTSWNPAAISTHISADTAQIMASLGYSTVNQYGFSL